MATPEAILPERHFSIVPGDEASSVVLHVPHAAMCIPTSERGRIVLDDDELAAELVAMTDAHTDLLAGAICHHAMARGTPQPWRFVNHLSRLVIDPERFPDEREEMNAVGMGVVYTRTSTGATLREEDPEDDRRLRRALYDPYHQALADLVDSRLSRVGAALILDLHSYPRDAAPYELHGDLRRPAFCLGTDASHTPRELVARASAALEPLSDVVCDEPFIGTFVPSRHLGRDRRVSSLMLEIRRDLLSAPGGPAGPDAMDGIGAAVAELVAWAS